MEQILIKKEKEEREIELTTHIYMSKRKNMSFLFISLP